MPEHSATGASPSIVVREGMMDDNVAIREHSERVFCGALHDRHPWLKNLSIYPVIQNVMTLTGIVLRVGDEVDALPLVACFLELSG